MDSPPKAVNGPWPEMHRMDREPPPVPPPRAVRYNDEQRTPMSEGLRQLQQHTMMQMQFLREKLAKNDPCYNLSSEHWHPKDFSVQKPSADQVNKALESATTIPTKEAEKMATGVFGNRAPVEKTFPSRRLPDSGSETKNLKKESGCQLCASSEKCNKHAHQKVKYRRTPYREKVPYKAPSVEHIQKKRESEKYVEDKEVLWKVTVSTGTEKGAGTSAKAFITIEGTKDVTQRWPLTKKTGSIDFHFGRGSSNVFFFQGPKLGTPRKIRIEHEGSEKKDDWLVTEVRVTNLQKERTWMFPCNKWLTNFVGDCKPYRDLKGEEAKFDTSKYEVNIVTGDRAMASTDSAVYITLYGKEKVSPRLHLKAGQNDRALFQRGHVDKFLLELDQPIGPLTRIKMETDGKEDWFLRLVVIRDVEMNARWMFIYNEWLPTEQGETFVDILSQKITRKEAPIIESALNESTTTRSTEGNEAQYEVSFETGDKKMAGTDAKVFIQMYGKNATSSIKYFADKDKRYFERGRTDKFNFREEDVGPVIKIRVGHDNSGVAAGWYLERVTIRRDIERIHRSSDSRPGREITIRQPHGFSAPVGMERRREQAARRKQRLEEKERLKTEMENAKTRSEKLIARQKRGVGRPGESDDSEEEAYTQQVLADIYQQSLKQFRRMEDEDARHRKGEDRSDERSRSRDRKSGNRRSRSPTLSDSSDDINSRKSRTRSERRRTDYDEEERTHVERISEEYTFEVHKWFARDEGDGSIAREVRLSTERKLGGSGYDRDRYSDRYDSRTRDDRSTYSKYSDESRSKYRTGSGIFSSKDRKSSQSDLRRSLSELNTDSKHASRYDSSPRRGTDDKYSDKYSSKYDSKRADKDKYTSRYDENSTTSRYARSDDKYGRTGDKSSKYGRTDDKSSKYGRSDDKSSKYGRSDDKSSKYGRSDDKSSKYGEKSPRYDRESSYDLSRDKKYTSRYDSSGKRSPRYGDDVRDKSEGYDTSLKRSPRYDERKDREEKSTFDDQRKSRYDSLDDKKYSPRSSSKTSKDTTGKQSPRSSTERKPSVLDHLFSSGHFDEPGPAHSSGKSSSTRSASPLASHSVSARSPSTGRKSLSTSDRFSSGRSSPPRELSTASPRPSIRSGSPRLRPSSPSMGSQDSLQSILKGTRGSSEFTSRSTNDPRNVTFNKRPQLKLFQS